ncbi:N-acetylmuramoyl-L-alanine amidase CwlA precursor [Pelotomaculum sp. FP]|uniref:peptidoglycan-binding domain-containing protein n=1 Tax=Pelotomaculum sp. FP TaxID=261474 RepID=UPI0010662AD9|nr:peptidoglycan-binding domain-containing protein [Pelotomaculum sp. FP]TEB16038.1 N-acetylmuramoyl-L-alanine amidase CwlA precursor [Pelotomaculum sp. FP]
MNITNAAKLRKVSLIMALLFVLALSVGLCTASAAENQSYDIVARHLNPNGTINLEKGLDEPILPTAPSLTPAYSITGTILGESSEEIKAIQAKLVSLGYDTGGIDGIYGPKTVNAVRLFQQSHNLIVDGIAGPQTKAALGIYN